MDTFAEPEVLRKKYSDKEREKIPLEDFGDPDNRAFPIVEAEDVTHAASRLHNATGSQAKIKKRIIAIAKRKGFALPDTWTEEGRAMGVDVTRAFDPAVSAASMYVPITRIDKDEWIIEGQATSDQIDAYGTIFDYESSKKAFTDWRGNIREMHQNKAVGRAVEWQPDDEAHAITLRARISKGAKDTWEKICDGTLSGFSIALPQGGYKVKTVERGGKSVPMYYDHRLAEVSVVDNPGSPGCDIAIVRADGMITDVLDDAEATPEPQTDTTRAGARVSHTTQSDLHSLRDGHLQGAKKVMQICECDECQVGCSALDPDNDGDIDLMPTSSLDWDSDGGSKDMMADYRTIEAIIQRALAPHIQRENAMIARMAAFSPQIPVQAIDTSAIERRLEAIETQAASLDEVRSVLTEVKGLVNAIANQPQAGGPFTNAQAMDKLLATRGIQSHQTISDADVITRAAAMGLLKNATQEQQTQAAAAQIRQMFGQQ